MLSQYSCTIIIQTPLCQRAVLLWGLVTTHALLAVTGSITPEPSQWAS